MNLYKIEYDLDEKKFKADIEAHITTEDAMKLVLSKLTTHLFASNLFDAVEKVKANVPINKYITVGKVTPEVIDIRIME